MASVQDYSTLFKDQYGKGPVNLLPSADKFQKLFPFASAELVGGQFIEDLDVEFEHGFTFGGNQVAPTLAGSVAAENVQAKITPSQIIGQKTVGYRDIVRTMGGGKRAFAPVVSKRITDLMRGTRRNIEISMMHGQSTKGIGVVASISAGTNGTITLTADSTAPGIWAGARNMPFDVWDPTFTTKRGSVTVTSTNPTNPDAFTVTFSGTLTSCVANDVLVRNAAFASSAWQECVGVRQILSNTGTLFNVDASLHPLWAANSYPVGGRLTVRDILAANDLAVHKGLDGDTICFIPVRAYSKLNDDANSLRVMDESYDSKKAELGVESIALHGQTGRIILVPHLYMLQSEAWILPIDTSKDSNTADKPVKRIGSTDVTFGMPGAQGGTESDDIFVQSATTAAVEIRNFTDQAPFIQMPGHCAILTGITYPSN